MLQRSRATVTGLWKQNHCRQREEKVAEGRKVERKKRRELLHLTHRVGIINASKVHTHKKKYGNYVH